MEKTLPVEFNHRGVLVTRVIRDGDWAVYMKPVSATTKPVYELVRIRHLPDQWFGKSFCPARESYPTDEEWGVHGFTFDKLTDALDAFHVKVKLEKEKAI